MKPSVRIAATGAIAILALVVLPATAWGHGGMEEEPGQEQGVMESGHGAEEGAGEEAEVPLIELGVPEGAELGSRVTLRATLTDPHDGRPIADASIVFQAPAVWGEEIRGWMVLGAATTDRKGTASLTTQVRTSGEVEIRAVFLGGEGFAPASGSAHLDVLGDAQLYEPAVGIRVPWLNLWLLAAVIGLVWGMYLLVGRRVLAIARPERAVVAVGEGSTPPSSGATSRRSFLARALPFGAQAGIAVMGTGLVALVARSPRTHGNLMAPPATLDYHRTAVARVGESMEMQPMPPALDRPVSFSREVLPIFLASGGPHVVAPEHSPPPGGLRLDSYEGVMGKEGVVVPGRPEESELVEHLLSVGMQMPPSVPPLPGEQIQLIVTWIAQGASDN
ncbi:MAG TPA: c-type cytochrome domain-containing protein [Actinomycetota bacterium]